MLKTINGEFGNLINRNQELEDTVRRLESDQHSPLKNNDNETINILKQTLLKQQAENDKIKDSFQFERENYRLEKEGLIMQINQSQARMEMLEKEVAAQANINYNQDPMGRNQNIQEQHLKAENMNLKMRIDELLHKLNETDRVSNK